MKTPTATLAVLTVLAGLLACGAAAGTSGLPRGALIARANAICTTTKSKLSQLLAGGSGFDAHSPRFRREIPIFDRQVSRLRTVRPAARSAGQWHAFVRAVVIFDRQLPVVAHAPRSDVAAVPKLVRAASAAAAAGVRLGARSCRL